MQSRDELLDKAFTNPMQGFREDSDSDDDEAKSGKAKLAGRQVLQAAVASLK